MSDARPHSTHDIPDSIDSTHVTSDVTGGLMKATDDALPPWVVQELRRPVVSDPAARQRIMVRVRAVATPADIHPLWPRHGQGWRARRGLASLTGLATAAGLASVIALGAARMGLSPSSADDPGAVWRDTLHAVTGRGGLTSVVMPAPATGAAGDSLGAALLRDTLRLMRFVLVAPNATRLALVGDFNGWNARATPMVAVAESTGMWEARVALRPGAHRYAFVQDDTQWVAGPATTQVILP